MKSRYTYNELELHFTEPARVRKHKRVPRKFKKKWKHLICNDRYDFLTLDQKLWHILNHTNRDYVRFRIKQICKR